MSVSLSREEYEDMETRIAELEAEVERLRGALEQMAKEDWRGNKPNHVSLAQRTLAALTPEGTQEAITQMQEQPDTYDPALD